MVPEDALLREVVAARIVPSRVEDIGNRHAHPAGGSIVSTSR